MNCGPLAGPGPLRSLDYGHAHKGGAGEQIEVPVQVVSRDGELCGDRRIADRALWCGKVSSWSR